MGNDDTIRLQEQLDKLTEEVRALREQLAEREDKYPIPVASPYTNVEGYIPGPCRSCPNHPNNGGSGVCHCILGSPTIC